MSGPGFVIQKRFIRKHTPDEFYGTYKNHTLNIWREIGDRYGSEFYIMVWFEDGGMTYDGWWGDPGQTIEEAVAEAIRGSCINTKRVERAAQEARIICEAQSHRPLFGNEQVRPGVCDVLPIHAASTP